MLFILSQRHLIFPAVYLWWILDCVLVPLIVRVYLLLTLFGSAMWVVWIIKIVGLLCFTTIELVHKGEYLLVFIVLVNDLILAVAKGTVGRGLSKLNLASLFPKADDIFKRVVFCVNSRTLLSNLPLNNVLVGSMASVLVLLCQLLVFDEHFPRKELFMWFLGDWLVLFGHLALLK